MLNEFYTVVTKITSLFNERVRKHLVQFDNFPRTRNVL